MNEWLPMAESPWQLAGWTMLHFLWAGTLVAAAGGALRAACRRAAATVRYAISLGTLAALVATPLVVGVVLAQRSGGWHAELAVSEKLPYVGEFLRNSHSDEQVSTRLEKDRPWDAAPPDVRGEVAGGVDRGATLGRSPGLEWVVAWLPWVWLAGAPVTFAWLAAGLVGSRRLRRSSRPLDDGPVVDACRRLERSLGASRQAALAVCDALVQPVLVGIVRPTILLPAAALSGWSPQELEMVLVHELAHIRRWDNLVNLGQRVVESLLFFHPAVWLVSRQVRRDREECCDAAVVRHTQQPAAYASLLVSIAASLGRRPAPALVAASTLASHPLHGRVRRILNLEDEPMWISRRMLGLLVVLAVGLTTAAYRSAVAVPAAVEASPGDAELAPASADDRPAAVESAAPVEPTTDKPPARVVRRLAPGDVLHVEVRGLSHDAPIHGRYVVESEGTVALGALYGRIDVAGLTVREAEETLLAHLGEFVSEPLVQIQLASPATEIVSGPVVAALPDAVLVDAPDELRYDGKTFDEWSRLWRQELKVGLRVQAVAALAAFARAGREPEAVAAILDVAGQYDFSSQSNAGEKELMNVILHYFAGQGAAIPPDAWLAQLVARMDEAEGERAARWQTMLVWLLKRWPAQEVEPPALLRELAERPGADQQRLREAATLALLHCVIGADQIADERIVDLVREKLAGDRPSMNMLSLLAFRNLEQFPEQVDLLFHQHPAAQLSARRILGGSSNGSVAEVYGLLRDRIAHPKTPAEAIAALRALVVVADRLNPQQQTELGDMLAELLSTSDDPNILAPALIAYARVQRLEEWQAKDTVETGAGPRSAAETAPLRKALELVPSERRQIFGG